MRRAEAWPFMKAAVQQGQYGGRDPLPMNLPIHPTGAGAAFSCARISSCDSCTCVWAPIIGSSPSLHAPTRAITNALPVRFMAFCG